VIVHQGYPDAYIYGNILDTDGTVVIQNCQLISRSANYQLIGNYLYLF
jgi:hypothetical protein